MQFFNHYSVPIIGALIFVVVFSAVRRRGQWWVLAGVMVVYIGAYLALRPIAKPAMQLDGKSLLLEVQSPFCLGCVALKPAVDRLENELRGKLRVRRVDIQSDVGQKLVTEYGIEFTPTFVFFDTAGKEQWRSVGQLDAARVRATLTPR